MAWNGKSWTHFSPHQTERTDEEIEEKMKSLFNKMDGEWVGGEMKRCGGMRSGVEDGWLMER